MFTTPQPPVSYSAPATRRGVILASLIVWFPILTAVAQAVAR